MIQWFDYVWTLMNNVISLNIYSIQLYHLNIYMHYTL